jgi:hypothetical protein
MIHPKGKSLPLTRRNIMDVSKYKFSDDEIHLLKNFRDNQEDSRLKLRFLSLLMLAEGLELDKVASIIGKSEKTIENWFYQYQIKHPPPEGVVLV